MNIPIWTNLGTTKKHWVLFIVGLAAGWFAHRLLA